jgi:hypothetical protein
MSGPLVDCSGTPVVWFGEASNCEEKTPEAKPLESTELADRDVFLTPLSANTQLVWVVAKRFDSGEGLGPVGVVETTPEGKVVRGVGTLRAFTKNPQHRVEKVGKTEFLVAEGEHCPKSGGRCERSVRIMPLRGGRFVPEPLSHPQGACIGPALFYLSRTASERLPNGWERRYEFNTGLSFGPSGITADEKMSINEVDPRQPNQPGRLLRRAELRREVSVLPARLVTEESSLWSRFFDSK